MSFRSTRSGIVRRLLHRVVTDSATLGVDCDSHIVALDFDERDPGTLEMFRQAVVGAKRMGANVRTAGASANHPEIARYLTQLLVSIDQCQSAGVPPTMAGSRG